MPELGAEDRTPVSTAYVMKRRLHAPAEVLSDWQNNYIFTADGAEYEGKGAVKIILDDSALLTIDKQSKLTAGALVSAIQDWENLSGKEILYLSKIVARDLHGKGYVKEKHSGKYVPQSSDVEKFWNFVSRGEVDIDEYLRAVAEVSEQDVIMKIYFGGGYYSTPVGRSLICSSFGDHSNALGGSRLNKDYGRLFGVKLDHTQIKDAVRVQELLPVTSSERSNPNQPLTQSIHDQKSLEWARRLLDGTAGGTVLDY